MRMCGGVLVCLRERVRYFGYKYVCVNIRENVSVRNNALLHETERGCEFMREREFYNT